jgi:hypothetical protein
VKKKREKDEFSERPLRRRKKDPDYNPERELQRKTLYTNLVKFIKYN